MIPTTEKREGELGVGGGGGGRERGPWRVGWWVVGAVTQLHVKTDREDDNTLQKDGLVGGNEREEFPPDMSAKDRSIFIIHTIFWAPPTFGSAKP